MKRRKVGDVRYLKHPVTGTRVAASKIVEIADGGTVDNDWGKYEFQAWLEEDLAKPGYFYISFPYYRNGRFAAQYTFRAPPAAVRSIVRQIQRRGWLRRPGWKVSVV